MAHRNARLTVHGRRLLITRVVRDERPVAHVVKKLGCSRQTGYKWLARWRAEGDAGLLDRPSTAHWLPGKTSPEQEARVCDLRTVLKRGPRRLAPLPGASLRDVMARMGHDSPRAALIYQHASHEADQGIAEAIDRAVKAARRKPSRRTPQPARRRRRGRVGEANGTLMARPGA